MKFVIDIPDSEIERLSALALGIQGKMVFNGFNVGLDEKLILGMSQAITHGNVVIPLDQKKYQDLESLKGANYRDEFIVIRLG